VDASASTPLAAGSGGAAAARSPVLALDIGGTKLAAGVVDESGRVHSFLVTPSEADRGPDAVLTRLFELGRRAVEDSQLGWAGISAVGIGCGGPLDAERGLLLSPPHLPGWRDVPVTALAEREFERPAWLDNDGTAAAAAQHRYRAGRGTEEKV
jgi:glucokinase